jgi:hypothetical protein
VSSTNRIKEDFGVSVRFLETRGPELLLGKESDSYPSGVRLARSPCVVAEITYPKNKTSVSKKGALIFIKSTMMTGLDFATQGYRATSPDFPHQSTADQFFDPDQFEAYRDLGKKSCSFMVKELDLVNNFENAPVLLKNYGFK